jgi:isocitrate dehydrogenase (NAD+)
VGFGHRSINVALRKALNLYANLRPVKRLPGIRTPFEKVDMVIVRENTEDLYAGIEHTVVPGVVESLKIITEVASTRIARWAFDYARKSGRKKIAAVHKANIMKLSDGLFLECIRKVAKEFPEIEYRELIVDNACMQLVLRPEQFDVLLMENLYGDIVSDLCSGLVGGLGLVPGANLGDGVAIFEAVHGSAPDIAGKGIANPTAMMLSAVLMLRHLGLVTAADRIEKSIHQVYAAGKVLTNDVGGKASTEEFTSAVIDGLA